MKKTLPIVVECTPDQEAQHEYTGSITFTAPSHGINAVLTFRARYRDENIYFVFFNRRGNLLFEFDQSKAEKGDQISTEIEEQSFRLIAIQAALEGFEGSANVAEIFYKGGKRRDLGLHVQLAGLISYRKEMSVNLDILPEETEAALILKLQKMT